MLLFALKWFTSSFLFFCDKHAIPLCVYIGGGGGHWWRPSQTAKPQAAETLAETSQVCVARWGAPPASPRNVWNATGVPVGGGQGFPATDHHHGNTTWSFQVQCVCVVVACYSWRKWILSFLSGITGFLSFLLEFIFFIVAKESDHKGFFLAVEAMLWSTSTFCCHSNG